MKVKKISASLSLVFLMLCLMLPNVYAIVYAWAGAPDTLAIPAAKYFSSSYGGGGGYVWGFLFMLVFLLAVIGAVIGNVLWRKVNGRHMMIGSALYWTFALLYLSVIVYTTLLRVFPYVSILQGLLIATLLSTPVALSSNITYIMAHIARRRKLKHSIKEN